MEQQPAGGDARPLWEQNGMTESEWLALSDEARVWRTEHPRIDHPASDNASAPVGAAPVRGAQVVLVGAAQDAARGVHATIEANTAARDGAIAGGHVAEGTSEAAVADALSASIGTAPAGGGHAEVAAARRQVAEAMRVGGKPE